MAALYGHRDLKTISKILGFPKNSDQPSLKFRSQLVKGTSQLKVATRKKGDAQYTSAVIAWFTSLPSEDREHVLTIHDPVFSSLMLQLHLKNTFDEHSQVCLLKEIEADRPIELDEIFFIRKQKRDKESDCERKLEELVRFTDSKQYLDTVTVDHTVEPQAFIDLLKQVSANQAFKVPCRLIPPKQLGLEFPPWLLPSHNSFNSLAKWLAAAFEQAIWRHYWTTRKPQRPSSLQQKLLDCWSSLKNHHKEKTLELLQKFAETYEVIEGELARKPPKAYPRWATGSVSQLHSNAQDLSSLLVIPQNFEAMDDREFIYSLTHTPLTRAFSLFDIAVRKLVPELLKLASQLELNELLSNLPAQPTPKLAVKKPKAKKYPQKNVSSRPAQAMPEPRTEETVQLNNPVTVTTTEDLQGFQVVSKPRKKREPKPTTPKQRVFIEESSQPRTPETQQVERKILVTKVLSVQVSPKTLLFTPYFPPPCAFEQLTFRKLHQEIVEFQAATLQQATQNMGAIQVVTSGITQFVNSLFPGSLVTLFGSYALQLAIPASDVDLQITNSFCMTRANVQEGCRELSSHFQCWPYINKVQCLEKATVPLIKLELDLSHFLGKGVLKFDISFNDLSTHLGLNSLKYSQSCLAEFPALSFLVIILKTLLNVNDLDTPYTGGLGSYSVLIWTVAYLRSLDTVSEDYGQLLVDLLGFYGKVFDPERQTIDIREGQSFGVKPEASPSMVTMDPACPTNNTTRTCFNYRKVLDLFGRANLVLLSQRSQKHVLHKILVPFEAGPVN